MIEKELEKLIKKALKIGEVPVAAIIIKDNKIISKAYNKRNSTNNPLKHAEILAIMKAVKKIKDWRLENCEMYVTLEPCHMCREVIKECRIKNVYYYAKKDKLINYKTDFLYLENSFSSSYKKLLTSFFKELR